jgi:D-amino-acid dehydrogenase
MRTVVLGSGIAGVATAYYLAKLGHKVTVIDRQAEPALETSFANGGVIGATQIEPWPSPGLPLKIVQWIGRQDAPLLLHLNQLPRMWRWGVQFLRNCREARFYRNMAANLRLTLYSLNAYAEIRAETGITYDLLARGALKIYLSREALDHAVRRSESLRSLGMPFRAVDVPECVKIEPALSDAASTLAGGIYFPREEVGDCRKFVVALAQRCTAMGVAFHFGTTIRGLSKFINAGHGPQGWSTGAGSARVIADLIADRSPELDLTDLTLERFN